MHNLSQRKFLILATIIMLVASVNLFYKLGYCKVKNWDEARQGISAYDMIRSGDLIVTKYLETIDYWNTKPPLEIWLVALSMKLFGTNALALRFPSALSALLSILLTILFARKLFNNSIALLAGIILATTYLFIHFHSGRTGDYDAQLTLLILIAVWLWWEFNQSQKIVYFFAVAFVFALIFLLKSIAVILPVGIIFVLFILDKNYRHLRFRHYLVFVSIALTPVLLWVYFRFQADGWAFFKAMLENDLIKRSVTASEGNTGGIFYYVIIFCFINFPWGLVATLGLLWHLKIIVKRDGRFYFFTIRTNELYSNKTLIVWLFVPFAIATVITTKVYWYINPMYPPAAMCAGWLIFHAVISDKPFFNGKLRKWLIFFTVITFIGAEGMVFGWIIYRGPTPIQQFLRKIEPSSSEPLTRIYKIGDFEPAERFICYAERNLMPAYAKNIESFFKKAEMGDMVVVERVDTTYIQYKNKLIEIIADRNFKLLKKTEEANILP